MAFWQQGSKLTAKGLALQSKMLAGTVFAFTRASMSSVYVPPEDQEALTDLPDHKQDLYLQPVTLNSDGTATLLILLTNDDVTTSYTAHTIGIYAQDPDDGEILYATMTDKTGDVIPTYSEAPNSSIDWNTTIGYGNATEIIIQREPNSYVSLAVANQLIDEHNTSPNAHEALFTSKADLVNGVVPGSQLPSLDYIPTSEKGAAGGVAPLDGNEKLLMKHIPDEINTSISELNLKVTGVTGDVAALAFDMAIYGLLSTGSMKQIIADKIGSADDIVLVSGQYADNKVYI